MTATCREACCSVTPRFTVAELFERGYRRNREAPLSIEGEAVVGAEENHARFSIEIVDGKLAAARFRTTACTTLIAYCEAIAELLPGFNLEIAGALTPKELVDALPGVPPLKQDRAVLAVAAFRAALHAAHSHDLSWPGLSRSSTPLTSAREDVDARNKCGHDDAHGGEAA
jgi:NifU-like protein involved in Fe-S cluster formation